MTLPGGGIPHEQLAWAVLHADAGGRDPGAVQAESAPVDRVAGDASQDVEGIPASRGPRSGPRNPNRRWPPPSPGRRRTPGSRALCAHAGARFAGQTYVPQSHGHVSAARQQRPTARYERQVGDVDVVTGFDDQPTAHHRQSLRIADSVPALRRLYSRRFLGGRELEMEET
jgi:hypothetical protein